MTTLDPYLKLFDYHLPEDRIAQTPITPRDHSKLIVLNRHSGKVRHHVFKDLTGLLNPNDVLILNQTKVFPARIKGKKETGGKVELLLTRPLYHQSWEAIGFGNLAPATKIVFSPKLNATVTNKDANTGIVTVEFNLPTEKIQTLLQQIGLTPLPPYITAQLDQKMVSKRYQTTYAKEVGSSAAPTAGLHFTRSLLNRLKTGGVTIEFITLHVGPGTFMPLREKQLEQSTLHREYYSIDPQTAQRLIKYKKQGKRLIAVGTTTTRTLESAYQQDRLKTGPQSTTLFIKPPYQFKFINALITNFHLPQSSLLMLVSSLVSFPNTIHHFKDFQSSVIGQAYQTAINQSYRFYSFGDAMLVL